MIDHITIAVSDLENSKRFYERALEPLGYRLSFGKEAVFCAFDVGDGSLFEIQQSDAAPPLTRVHVAFRRAEVDAFYRAALDAGALENGAPAHARSMPRTTMPALSLVPMDTTWRR
jgi:catechol 2,3-dioxygenase-like lactoylglutathione lyase family enzyme